MAWHGDKHSRRAASGYASTRLHRPRYAPPRAATEAYAAARARVLAFLGADPDRYVCLFVGNGATGALNRAAHYLGACRSDARTVLVSLMEHHSNDLPHRRRCRVRHVPLAGVAPALGAIDADAFTALLRAEPVKYAALSMISNVTGVVNPIDRIGMEAIADHEQALTELLLAELLRVPEVRLYGSPAALPASRIGVASFNVGALDHGFVAAALNDYFCIAVRNGCFCAHPYVQALLGPELWVWRFPTTRTKPGAK